MGTLKTFLLRVWLTAVWILMAPVIYLASYAVDIEWEFGSVLRDLWRK